MVEDVSTLLYWREDWWSWDGVTFRRVSEADIRSRLWAFLDGVNKPVGKEGVTRFMPEGRHVNELLAALKGAVFLADDAAPPLWLERETAKDKGIVRVRAPALEMVAFRNKLVNIETGEVFGPTPKFWNHHALDFDYEPEAKCPTWDWYLKESLAGNGEAQEFLEEWGGYCMTWETKYQKAVLLYGRPRAGKGTYLIVLEWMVGPGAYVGLTVEDLAGENSKADLIDKKVYAFADERLKPGKQWGEVWDAGGLPLHCVKLFLKVTGDDSQSVGIKYEKFKWKGRLDGKINYVSNVIPNFNDPTGALEARFIAAHFPRNFEEEGKLDVDLQEKLKAERAGIANRLMEGYRRLRSRGGFVEPKEGGIIRKKISAQTRALAVFFDACFEFREGARIPKWTLFAAWRWWAEKEGLYRLLEKYTPSLLTKEVGAEVKKWNPKDDWRDHGRLEYYNGIWLRDDAELFAALEEYAEEKLRPWPDTNMRSKAPERVG
jgi:putative DNA primase/helicase